MWLGTVHCFGGYVKKGMDVIRIRIRPLELAASGNKTFPTQEDSVLSLMPLLIGDDIEIN